MDIDIIQQENNELKEKVKDLEEKHNHLLKSIKTSILIKKQVETL